jgi:outer membrane receptor protein involved in Fe transport
MNSRGNSFFTRRARALFVLLFVGAQAIAQTVAASRPANSAPAAGSTAAAANDDTIQLTAFEVKADSDTSYGALQSNSLTSFRIDLEKMPATAQVFTKTFMDDIAASSIEEVLTGYAGTVTANASNANSMIAAPGDRDGGGGLSIRGTGAGDTKRDGFVGPKSHGRTISGFTDNFSIERVEVIEGPQSILYGAVGGGGVINTVSKRGQFNRRAGEFRVRFDQFGSKRALLDYNYGVKNVAIRVAATAAEERSFRYNLGSDSYGFYTEVAFKIGQNSILRLHTEKTDTWAMHARKPNVDNFLPVGDPRRGKDARFLALTNQLADVTTIWDGGVSYRNLESFAGWFNSEHIKDHWSGLVFETKLPWNFSAQLGAMYDDMVDNRLDVFNATLVPGAGKTGAGANPYPGTAYRLPAGNLQDNQQRNRDKGVRLALLHEKDFSVWKLRGRSQTVLGAMGNHQYPGFGSGGITHAYYLADASGNPVINSAQATEYGRTLLTTDLYVPVQSGIPLRPLFMPTAPRITVNGQTYVRMPRLITNPANETPANFKGVVPNNGASGFNGSFNNNAETHSRYFYATNYTSWNDGRLTTLLGYGFTNFESLNFSATPPNTFVKFKYLPGWGAGANYRLLPWLRAYALISKSAQASGSTDDIIGVPLKTPDAKSPVPEIGLKFNSGDNRYQAQLNWNPSTLTRYENKNIGDLSYTDIINPDGINRRFGTGSRAQQRVNLDRTLESMSLSFTANPIHNWRMRLQATRLDGKIDKDVSYQQLYNDQFYASNGVVTYKDGTPVLVDPAGGNGAKTAQLTLAMINDPANPYGARPNPDSGTITNTTLKTVLTTADPVRGTAATGVTGLPITSTQYTFTSPFPNGEVLIYKAGEKNTGFNEYTLNFQNNYTFSSGFLKGFGVFTDVQTYLKNRAYYTVYPGSGNSTSAAKQVRALYRLPTATVLNLGFSYRIRRLPWLSEKYQLATQLNVRNALNHYNVWVIPSPGNGNTLNARLSAQPRQFLWTNTLSF